MGCGHYILDCNGNPVLENDTIAWARWFGESDRLRVVKQETIGDSKVSTVFLGLDHCFGDGPPVLWETMVFGGKLDEEQDRCSGSREQAEAMHEAMKQRVKEANVTRSFDFE